MAETRLHESSRRSKNECGIDVIVATATTRSTKGGNDLRNKFATDEVSQGLVAPAKGPVPEFALAKYGD